MVKSSLCKSRAIHSPVCAVAISTKRALWPLLRSQHALIRTLNLCAMTIITLFVRQSQVLLICHLFWWRSGGRVNCSCIPPQDLAVVRVVRDKLLLICRFQLAHMSIMNGLIHCEINDLISSFVDSDSQLYIT